jgi:hypothetical protein
MDRTRYNEFVWWSNLVGATRAIIPNGLDSSGNWTFTPYPMPDSPYVLEFYYLKRISDLSSDSESPIFPARFQTVWIEGALSYGYRFMDDSRYQDCFKLFTGRIEQMYNKDNPMSQQHWVIKPYDQIPANRGLMLPSSYGPNNGGN